MKRERRSPHSTPMTGEELSSLRKAMGLTRKEWVERMGYKPGTGLGHISRMERGDIAVSKRVERLTREATALLVKESRDV